VVRDELTAVTRKLLTVVPERCTGCLVCELVCSFYHTKEFNPERSRIDILRDEENGINIPVICRQCARPLCQEACPSDAIHRDEETGAMSVDGSKCIGCRLCIAACPFGAPSVDPTTMLTTICDLCRGDPRCVRYCPRDAVLYVRPDRISLVRRQEGVKKMARLAS